MIAVTFTFPAGRYHATPWGRHANEADVAWPPEPVRILRALIATWWRKADHEQFPKEILDELIEALAGQLPVFHLPDAVHSHVRAYMPAPTDRKLIYDAFLRFDSDARLVVCWPDVILTEPQKTMAGYLFERMGYLGRAESWVIAYLTDDWDGEVNAHPRSASHRPSEKSTPVDIAVALTREEWCKARTKFLTETKQLTGSKRAILEATLPDRLSDALAVDTSAWHKAGWSSPPPMRKVVYDRPPVGPLAFPRPRGKPVSSGQPGTPEIARFVLAGRPRPRVEDSLRIGEIARAALMSGSGDPPPEFTGRDNASPRRDDPGHAHAFFLPEDADGDGLIDHLVIYCRLGFSREARLRLDRLNKLWIARGRANDEGERGHEEWRVALEDIASPGAFGDVSALVRSSCEWTSLTPYLKPWHTKRDFGVVEQIRREIERRGTFGVPADITVHNQNEISKRTLSFHRIRSRRGLMQPDTQGCFVTMHFNEPVAGPIVLGFGCHYGLGLFGAK